MEGFLGVLLGGLLTGGFAIWTARSTAASARLLQQERLDHDLAIQRSSIRLERLEDLHVQLEAWTRGLGVLLQNDVQWLNGQISWDARHEALIDLHKTAKFDFARMQALLKIHLADKGKEVQAMMDARRTAMKFGHDATAEYIAGRQASIDTDDILNAWQEFDRTAYVVLGAIAEAAREAAGT